MTSPGAVIFCAVIVPYNYSNNSEMGLKSGEQLYLARYKPFAKRENIWVDSCGAEETPALGRCMCTDPCMP